MISKRDLEGMNREELFEVAVDLLEKMEKLEELNRWTFLCMVNTNRELLLLQEAEKAKRIGRV